MKNILRFFYLPVAVIVTIFALSSFIIDKKEKVYLSFPYKNAGLTEREAALHLLNRFTYGVKPGDVDKVLKIGLEKWFQKQLNASYKNDSLNQILKNYDAINFTNQEVANIYPKGPKILRMAIKEGYINKDSVNKGDKKEYRDKLDAYMKQKGYKPQQELFRQFFNQKILRATYTDNQLQEILTDFWFNHFNVSMTKNDCAMYIPAYERDVIRPNVLGKFETILIATAKSPAMLFYLDNFNSAGNNLQTQANNGMTKQMQQGDAKIKTEAIQKLQQTKKNQGLNENYAREVMELHTLGVDGGYTQKDVTEAAKILTGWTVFPLDEEGAGGAIKKLIDKGGEAALLKRGFVHEGDFLFAANRHDTSEKTFLGKKFNANGGYEEGLELLKMLAAHQSTAKFISKKLAIRFVTDAPSDALIDKIAKTFIIKNGDIKQVLATMVNAAEFWNKETLREKTKTPFELAISAVRSLNATLIQPYQIYTWVSKMGQKMYYYQAPTGFPDKGQYWINTGALLNRMNFGLAIASQKIPGVKINLADLNNNHEPESSAAALSTYSKIIMPERDLSETIKRLLPMLNDPNLINKVDQAASKASVPNPSTNATMSGDNTMIAHEEMMMKPSAKLALKQINRNQSVAGDNSMLAQVVGVIIGSPEFQKR
jgi:uncharacterized protein (DUF1800 family)